MTTDAATQAVDAYFEEHLIEEDAALLGAIKRSDAAGLVPHAVSPTQGAFLNLLTRICGARRVLEIGMLGGYSTIWFARALPPSGVVVTLEVDPVCVETASANFAYAGLSNRVDIRSGPATENLDGLIAEGAPPFDLVFIDADKPNNPVYLEKSLALSRPGTVIVGDNIVRDGEVGNPESTDPCVRGVRRFIEMMGADPRLDATALQTVGTKGYDGFSIAVVR